MYIFTVKLYISILNIIFKTLIYCHHTISVFPLFFYFRSGKWSVQIVSLPSTVKVSAPESVIRKGKHAVQWRRKRCLWLWKWHINKKKKTFRRKCSLKPRHQCQWPSYWRWNSHTKCISQYRCNKCHICCYWWLFMLWG